MSKRDTRKEGEKERERERVTVREGDTERAKETASVSERDSASELRDNLIASVDGTQCLAPGACHMPHATLYVHRHVKSPRQCGTGVGINWPLRPIELNKLIRFHRYKLTSTRNNAISLARRRRQVCLCRETRLTLKHFNLH